MERLLAMEGISTFYCYDLSAATDRLPCSLQAHILDYLLGGSMGHFWRILLTERDYYLPKYSVKSGYKRSGRPVSSVKYAVGQPMGALSS